MCECILKILIIRTTYEDNKLAIRITKSNGSSVLEHLMKLHYNYISHVVKLQNVKLE